MTVKQSAKKSQSFKRSKGKNYVLEMLKQIGMCNRKPLASNMNCVHSGFIFCLIPPVFTKEGTPTGCPCSRYQWDGSYL